MERLAYAICGSHHVNPWTFRKVAERVAECGEKTVLEALRWAAASGESLKAALAKASTDEGRKGFEAAKKPGKRKLRVEDSAGYVPPPDPPPDREKLGVVF